MKLRVFDGRRLVLAVTGSISAYKVVDLASKLTQAGALVDVILTESAQQFVSALTFQSVTGRPVYTDLWQSVSGGALPTHIAHVGLAHDADLLAVIPATAHSIARLTHGMADDLLGVTALAATCPVVIAPAMDGSMYHHPAVADNLERLQQRGVWVIEPEVGRFASGLTGQGRLPETPTLMGHLRRVLGQRGPLNGRHVVVSAGGTREAIDPVRFLGNRSSGKQGYALAQAAVDAGADVTLVTTVDLPLPIGVYPVAVESAAQMRDAVLKHAEQADAVIMAAAVADFRPLRPSDQKIKKQEGLGLTLELGRTDDILLALQAKRQQIGRPRVLIGFAAESDQLLTNARRKLEQKGLDLLVANDITAPDAGFAVDTNRVSLLHRDGRQVTLDLMSKAQVAERIIDELALLLA
ncbi:bifunctional phosphopantothenoylcysteine decarboxylase/phosphopantothenate--cysteine ligase CoaBC [Aggregatilineales bacterium SYSU G02658]